MNYFQIKCSMFFIYQFLIRIPSYQNTANTLCRTTGQNTTKKSKFCWSLNDSVLKNALLMQFEE